MSAKRFAASALMLAACAKVPVGGDAVVELRTTDRALQAAVDSKDAERVASYYAEDAVMMPMAEPVIVGRAAIEEEWGHILEIPGLASTNELNWIAVSDSGDLGYTAGSYNARMEVKAGGVEDEPGKWVSVWRRDASGQWRIVMDIYNTDVLPADHK